MTWDLISYGLLAATFVITGLRMLVHKPNKMTEIPIWRKKIHREKNSTH